jgi:hypothetical protein
MFTPRRTATVAITLAALVLTGVAGAANPFPSTNPAQMFAGNEAGIVSDATVPIYLNGHSLTAWGSGAAAKAAFDDGLGGHWIITRSSAPTSTFHDHRTVINQGLVAIYNKDAKAYLVYSPTTTRVAFQKAPSLQWRVDKQAGDANLRLFNTVQGDYLAARFPSPSGQQRIGWLAEVTSQTRIDTQYVDMTRHILATDGQYYTGQSAARTGAITGIGNVNGFRVLVLRPGQTGNACVNPHANGVWLEPYTATTQDQLNQLGLLHKAAQATQLTICAGPSAGSTFRVTVRTSNATP